VPVFYQHQINEYTRLGIWKIEETEEFFRRNVPLQREVTHPRKRLQHLAGRFLLQFLFPGFPYELIRIADTLKPYLPEEQYHFSISHCGDYAAAIVSTDHQVGIDIEVPTSRIHRVSAKFLNASEKKFVEGNVKPGAGRWSETEFLCALWSSKEAIFKWYGKGGVDFSHHISLSGEIKIEKEDQLNLSFNFTRNIPRQLTVRVQLFEKLVLAWVVS